MTGTKKNCSVQCAYYAQCAVKTRVLLNYCGANNKGLGREIREAFALCEMQKTILHRGSAFPRFFPLDTIIADGLGRAKAA